MRSLRIALTCFALSWWGNSAVAQYAEREKLPAPQRVSRWNLSAAAVCIQPAPDQTEVAVATESGEVQIWPVSATSARLKAAAKDVLSLAWSPDGKSVAWSQRDGAVIVIDRQNGERRAILPPNYTPTEAVLFLLDRVTLACSQGKRLKLIDLESGDVFREADAPAAIRRLEYDYDGTRIIALTNPPGFAAFSIAHQAWEVTAPCAAEHVCYSHFNAGICRMDFLLPGKRAQSYVAAFGQTFAGHLAVESLGDRECNYAAAPHSDLLAVIKGGKVRLLDTGEYEECQQFSTGFALIELAQFNPSGTLLALAAKNELQVWKVPTYSALPAQVFGPGGLRYVKDSQVLICMGNSTITAWDCQTRACVAALPHAGEQKFAISADGTRLAVSSGEFTDVWNLESFSPFGRVTWDETIVPLELRRGQFPRPKKKNPLTPAHITTRYPVSMAISPDNQALAISRGDGSLQMWELQPLKKLADWLKPAPFYSSRTMLDTLAYSPDGKSLAGICSQGGLNFNKYKLQVFDVATQKKAPEFVYEAAGLFWFNWTSDSANLITTVVRDTPDRPTCLIRVDATTGREVEELLSKMPIWMGTTVGTLFATHDGQSLLIYDLDTKGTVLKKPQIGDTYTGGAALAPTRDTLAIGGTMGVSFVKIPRVPLPAAVPRAAELVWKPQTSHANALAWLSERAFATVLEDGQILLWETNQRTEQSKLKTRADSLSAAVTTLDGDFLLVAGSRNDRGWLEVVDLNKKQSVVEHAIDHASIVSLAVDRDGAVAWGTDQGELAVWDLPQRKVRWSRQVADEAVWNVAFQPAGKLLAVGGKAKSKLVAVLLLDTAMGEVETTISLALGAKLNALSWSPDGQQLAIASSTGLQLYEVRTKLAIVVAAAPAAISDVACLSDDELILAGADKKLHRLHHQRGALQVMASNRHAYESVAVSPSRQQVLTLDADSGIQLRSLHSQSNPQAGEPARPVAPDVRESKAVER